MPAGYAHITLVNLLRERLDEQDFSPEIIIAVGKNLKFCELGAVSPDYPYLAINDRGKARPWADAMHYARTVDMIRAGIERINDSNPRVRPKGIAWLLGYASHLVADVTVHPVVELKVGSYSGNETEHRICEINQDVHIYQRLNLDEIGLCEHLKSHLGSCHSSKNKKLLDEDIEGIWSGMFQDVHTAEFTKNKPLINKWYHGFKILMDKIAEEGINLPAFARHVCCDLGVVYPKASEIKLKYIQNLKTPGGQTKNYDEVFEQAMTNTLEVWKTIASAFDGDFSKLTNLGNWNLDTGRHVGDLIFWS